MGKSEERKLNSKCGIRKRSINSIPSNYDPILYVLCPSIQSDFRHLQSVFCHERGLTLCALPFAPCPSFRIPPSHFRIPPSASQPLSFPASIFLLPQHLERRSKRFFPGFDQQGVLGDGAGAMLRRFGACVQMLQKRVAYLAEMLFMGRSQIVWNLNQ